MLGTDLIAFAVEKKTLKTATVKFFLTNVWKFPRPKDESQHRAYIPSYTIYNRKTYSRKYPQWIRATFSVSERW